jgi:hypothetical protein
VGEPASLIATVLSRRSEATAVASTSLYTQNSVLNADSSWDLQKENWLLLLKWVITVAFPKSYGILERPAHCNHAHMRLPFCVINKKLTFATPSRVLITQISRARQGQTGPRRAYTAMRFALLSIAAALLQLASVRALPHAPLVPVEEVMEVLRAFEDIAAASPENARCVATGYNASAEYVLAELGGEGRGDYFDVETQHFVVPIYKELSLPLLQLPGSEPEVVFMQCQQSTGWQHYVRDCDYAGARYGGQGGDVTARAWWVGDGCDAEDYESMVPGMIALMNNAAQSTAECDNYEKALLAEGLGAAAIIFSGTMAPSRVFQATWREGDPMLTIPAIGVTASTGAVLRQDGGQITRVVTDTRIDVLHTYNVFATTLAGDADSTVMAGAHLDSVPEGPGINDNGSGSATMLAIARSFQQRGLVPNNRVRFAWWGAEEVGLIGSRHYVRDLVENDPPEFDRIALYLNFDMDASPNCRCFYLCCRSLAP